MGIGYARAAGAVRLSVGMSTTDEEVRRAGRALIEAWRAVRRA
jgi:cysteine sulfinate desulfinase/cysteine desulfurase-like protein